MHFDSLYVERIAGRRTRPLLVFLHHGLGCVSLWRDFPARLVQATECPALIYDRLGHGRSPPLPQPRTPRYLYDEAQALHHLLHTEKTPDFVLVGHSDGASIALLYAALPNAPPPRAIISEAAHLFVEDITRAGIRDAVDAYGQGLRERLVRHHGTKTDTLFWNWAGVWLAPSFDAFDIREQARRVCCPVFALQGSEDEYGSAAQIEAIRACCRGPVQTRFIPGARHEPHRQAFDTVFDVMRGALLSLL
ncbi:MAG: alpha/beta hydrolase [Bryobacterales bacterium]|nr:alpha/beta hydrolase [Bryobacterales bacterium]